jgi:hypothetical protein
LVFNIFIFICLRSTTPSCHFVALWTFYRRPSYPAVASRAVAAGQQEPTFPLPPLGYREATRLICISQIWQFQQFKSKYIFGKVLYRKCE